jgi:hypothetical protein
MEGRAVDPHVDLVFAGGAIVDDVVTAERHLGKLLDAVADEAGGLPGAVQWRVETASANGVVRIRNAGVQPAHGGGIGSAAFMAAQFVPAGLRSLTASSERPAMFTDDALESARSLSELSDRMDRLGVGDDSTVVPITADIAANVERILGPATESYGSVEGTLEGLNLHANARYFTIYELLRGRSVRCHFADRIDTGDIIAALEHRVTVYGQVKYRRDGAEHSVVAEELHVFPDDRDIPPFGSLRGILK